MEIVERQIQITNKLGLHARPAGKLLETAGNFNCDVQLIMDQGEANVKNILDVLSLACSQGTLITIRVAGDDPRPAMDAITELIGNNFGEE